MAGIDDKIATLETKLKQAKALKQKIDARKRSEASKIQRAQDTRRKILIGALVMESMGRDEDTNQRMLTRLDKYLTRVDDRALFELPAAKQQQPETPEQKR